MKSLSKLLVIGPLVAVLVNCSAKSTDLTGAPRPVAVTPKPKPADPKVFEQNFYFSTSEWTGEQNKFDENIITAFFQVEKDGQSVNGLKEKDLKVTESGNKEVRLFTLTGNEKDLTQVADIIFVVDITGTMVELIESAKKRLKDFIHTSRARGFHTRMCFSTFGDYTVKKCTRFFDNNPHDPSTNVQVEELLKELANIQAARGAGKDPGYPDLDENPLGALMDAAKAPWGENSQKFVILVTDWGFLYAPENMGKNTDPRKQVPTMKQVTEAIKTSKMKIFTVARTQTTLKGQHYVFDGYNTPFQGEKSLVETSGGHHFDFDDVRKDDTLLAQVLERILKDIKTSYTLTYSVEKAGLDPALPKDQRGLGIALKNVSGANVNIKDVRSSMPTGRPEYQKTWKISDQEINAGSMHVFVNDKEIRSTEYSVQKGELQFKDVPAPGSKIRASFLYEASEQNFRLEPINFEGYVIKSDAKVYLNDKLAGRDDYQFNQDLQGNSTLSISDHVLGANDPYEVRKNQSLKIRVVAE